jgi:hypothetical protein
VESLRLHADHIFPWEDGKRCGNAREFVSWFEGAYDLFAKMTPVRSWDPHDKVLQYYMPFGTRATALGYITPEGILFSHELMDEIHRLQSVILRNRRQQADEIHDGMTAAYSLQQAYLRVNQEIQALRGQIVKQKKEIEELQAKNELGELIRNYQVHPDPPSSSALPATPTTRTSKSEWKDTKQRLSSIPDAQASSSTRN